MNFIQNMLSIDIKKKNIKRERERGKFFTFLILPKQEKKSRNT